MDKLDRKPEPEYAIFDDFEDWSRLYCYKQFMGAQLEFELTDKYRAKRTIKWGKPCIIISNELPYFRDQKWIELNCFIVEIKEPMY